jgi:predicted Rossmann fold nucleotide-binding protein DprA/Smf involved in DNA uptake
MITARAGAALGRPIAASPGSPGTADLVVAGAAELEDAEQVLALHAGLRPARRVELPTTGSAAQRALAVLAAGAASTLEGIAESSGLSVVAAGAALVELELLGLCRALPGARWVRAQGACLEV